MLIMQPGKLVYAEPEQKSMSGQQIAHARDVSCDRHYMNGPSLDFDFDNPEVEGSC